MRHFHLISDFDGKNRLLYHPINKQNKINHIVHSFPGDADADMSNNRNILSDNIQFSRLITSNFFNSNQFEYLKYSQKRKQIQKKMFFPAQKIQTK